MEARFQTVAPPWIWANFVAIRIGPLFIDYAIRVLRAMYLSTGSGLLEKFTC